MLRTDSGVGLTRRYGRDQDAGVELDELREPWGDVPAVPEASLVRQRRYPPVPAGALRAYRRWLACED